jgi:hypothetical protein
MPDFRWDLRASRYRDSGGRFVPESAVRSWLDSAVDQSTNRMVSLTEQLQQGRLTMAEWQLQMMSEIKQAHLASAMAAHGGREAMSQADWGWAGQRIREQYQFLRNWANELANGTAPLDGRLISRARLYGNAPVTTFEAMKGRDARNSGAKMEERNVLSSADHCGECPSLAARGWLPLGTLPPVGTRECRVRDRCRIERRLVEAA